MDDSSGVRFPMGGAESLESRLLRMASQIEDQAREVTVGEVVAGLAGVIQAGCDEWTLDPIRGGIVANILSYLADGGDPNMLVCKFLGDRLSAFQQ